MQINVPAPYIICFYLICIRPVLEYCAPLYNHALPDYLTKDIERIQKRALSIISPGRYYDDSLSMFNMAFLEDRRIDQCEKKNCILFYLIQIISCIIFSLPRTIVIITSEDNATLQIQSCVPSVFVAHFCHLCAGVSGCCIKDNLILQIGTLKYKFVDFLELVHFRIVILVSNVFVNSCNSALEGCHMI